MITLTLWLEKDELMMNSGSGGSSRRVERVAEVVGVRGEVVNEKKQQELHHDSAQQMIAI
jgi:hypothetical protein